MNGERGAFLFMLHGLADDGVDDERIDQLGQAFASYEYEMTNAVRFLVERIGDIAVAPTVERAREIAEATLSEVLR